jgi:hypothetical protein
MPTPQALAALAQVQLAIPGLDLHKSGLDILIHKAIIGNWDQATLMLKIYASPQFKARFPGLRAGDGTLRMTPGQYLQQEEQIRQVMKRYKLHPGYYDKPSDFGKFIAMGIGAEEISRRLDVATGLLRKNPEIVKQLQGMYGLKGISNEKGLLAFMLDPRNGAQYYERALTAARIGVAAKQAGFTGLDKTFLEQLQSQGVTAEAAQQAFAQAGVERATLQTLAARYHAGTLSDKQIAGALFHPDPAIAGLRDFLMKREAAEFRGTSAVTQQQGRGLGQFKTSEAADLAYA